MSKAKSNNDSETSKYRIELTDIRGVGPATVEKLSKVDITTVEELHLLRNGRSSATESRLYSRDITIGKDTWEHLAAVGSAVHYTGGNSVEAKHLSGDIADDKEHWQFVDLTVDSPDTSDEATDEMDIPEYDTERLQMALDSIHEAYEEGYSNQVSFEADMGRFLSESETFDSEEHRLPMGIFQSVVRYRHNADRVESQGDFEEHHKSVLVHFSEKFL